MIETHARASRIGTWRGPVVALSVLAGFACSEPFDPPNNGPSPILIIPTERDTAPMPIAAENRLAGDPAWKDVGRADPDVLALWASPYVSSPGDTLDLYIHSATSTVSLQVYRLGWYSGLGGRLVHLQPAIRGEIQPRCTSPSSGEVACHWRRSTRLLVPHDWGGGIYLLKVRNTLGYTWSYPFVLRSGQPHRFTAIVNQFTWQAYNKWGGASFYSTDPATSYTYPRISFNRPYIGHGGMTAAGGAGEAGGSNDFPAVRWLEANGYDVGYLSDADLANSRTELSNIHALIFLGHDEYWTWAEFDRVESLRNAGTHLAFLSANNAYWNIRLAPGTVTGRPAETLICYKYQADPRPPTREQTTTKFRNPPLNRPESRLIGPIYQSLLPGGSHPAMVVPSYGSLGMDTRAFIAAAGLFPGDTLATDAGTEGDELFPDSPYTSSGTQMLLQAVQPIEGQDPRHFHSTFYIAPSGAGVWASGTNWWAAYLDGERKPVNPKVGRLTGVILEWMNTH